MNSESDIEYIHIKDAVYKDSINVVCGTGDGQIESILKQAITSGYKGFLTNLILLYLMQLKI
nr:hypothetical protein [Staphylococcus sp. KG4-3]MDW8561514.1 hypothetical protein [Staphylococcus sp. KG4-3]